LKVLIFPLIGEFTVLNIVIFVIGLIIIWLIVSIPVYLAGKVVTAGNSTLGDAMVATLFGPIVYAITLFAMDFLLGPLVGSSDYILSLIIAFVAWLAVFKASFGTGWLRALAIALLAVLILAGLSLLFGALLGIMIPAPFFPRI
jgi:hypothetical protein